MKQVENNNNEEEKRVDTNIKNGEDQHIRLDDINLFNIPSTFGKIDNRAAEIERKPLKYTEFRSRLHFNL